MRLATCPCKWKLGKLDTLHDINSLLMKWMRTSESLVSNIAVVTLTGDEFHLYTYSPNIAVS